MKQQHLKGGALRGRLEGGLQAWVIMRSLRTIEAGVCAAQLVPGQVVVGEPRHKLHAGRAVEWTKLRPSSVRAIVVQGICSSWDAHGSLMDAWCEIFGMVGVGRSQTGRQE